MILCGNYCEPCCDFCAYAKHGTAVVDGKRVTAGPIGCKLHKDEKYQDIAAACGFCGDFHCFKAVHYINSAVFEMEI